jgi:hypothetical protein
MRLMMILCSTPGSASSFGAGASTKTDPLDAYHGDLVAKEDYATDFRERFGRDPSYDTTKLRALCAHLIATAKRPRWPRRIGLLPVRWTLGSAE